MINSKWDSHEVVLPDTVLILLKGTVQARIVAIFVERAVYKHVWVSSLMLAVLKVALLHMIATAYQLSPVLYHDVSAWPSLNFSAWPSLNFGAAPILLGYCGIRAGVCLPVAPAGAPICPKGASSQPFCGGKREEAGIYSRVAEHVSTSRLVGDVQATAAILVEERI